MAYSYRQLEQLWMSQGGSGALAPIMAAIAMAESGGNPHAYNPSGATGLWQILGAVNPRDQGQLYDPNVNAREAVLKYKEQGLGAWTTYTSGAYKKFLQGGKAVKDLLTGQEILKEAEKFKGTPYVWGGESPKGFDCSGLVQYVLQKLGEKNVPRTSEEQWQWVHHLTRAELKPGDLVFFAGSDGTDSNPGHVAIYAGHDQIYQALETGTDVGLFPMSSAGTPVGYGRPPGVFGQGAGGGGDGGQGGSQDITLTDWSGGPTPPVAGFPIPVLSDVFGIISNATKLGPIGGPLAKISNTFVRAEQAIEWFFVPNHWVRIITGALGTGLVLSGIITMTRTGKGYSVNVPTPAGSTPVPAPGGELAPAMGIAEVTLGAILLFVSFHNLESEGVTDWPSLLHYYQEKLQTGGGTQS